MTEKTLHPCYLEIKEHLKNGCDLMSDEVSESLFKWERSLAMEREELNKLHRQSANEIYAGILQAGLRRQNK